MKVICFGDSNTYGYDPRGYLGGRYEADSYGCPPFPLCGNILQLWDIG